VHVSNIMDKMGVSSRTEAAVEAVKRGLVSSVDEE
jgi:DNA-binding NarL/FixJ family response regulator